MIHQKYDAVIIGSGAAGLSAATSLYNEGVKNIAILTEGLYMGTSINTGSDKQTYYKLSTTGNEVDSVMELAETLYRCGGMEGFHALTEAALSLRCFFKLTDTVPFPMNEYGEYVGYRTDHDTRRRASSCGPLTSKYMCEALIQRVKEQNTDVYENRRAVRLLCEDGTVYGVITYDIESGNFETYETRNVIFATGGPAGIYAASVYPKAQTGGIGIALEAGAAAVNLTEWQYGIASTDFRWNLSGSYQQVIPRYVSLLEDGTLHEFLPDYIDNLPFDLIFQKGYHWPFAPKNLCENKSSLIDIAVYLEQHGKRRPVYLDFRQNPEGFSYERLNDESYGYLKNSGLLQCKTPIERLHSLNEKAYKLYLDNGIDLEKELLAIDVCAQHCNGGLAVDKDYMTRIDGLFACGECAGAFGITRPGGTALNSTQVSSMRAAMRIKKRLETEQKDYNRFVDLKDKALRELSTFKDRLFANQTGETPKEIRYRFSSLMSKNGAFIREANAIEAAFAAIEKMFFSLAQNTVIQDNYGLNEAFVNRDLIVSALAVLFAEKVYFTSQAKSRGGFLILPDGADLLDYVKGEISLNQNTQQVTDVMLKDLSFTANSRTVSPIPESEQWFEKVAFGLK